MSDEQFIEALPTEYNGIVFRSQLEAQWAVFFDTLDEKWEYEKQVFQVEADLWYLPDFWLPKQERWIEIKPGVIWEGSVEERKAVGLFRVTGKPVYVLSGFPEVMTFVDLYDHSKHTIEICNYGTLHVNKGSPNKLSHSPFETSTLAMMEILGLLHQDMTEQEYRTANARFITAANRGMHHFEGLQWRGVLRNMMRDTRRDLKKRDIETDSDNEI